MRKRSLRRLATIERMQKFGINIPPDCAFCGQYTETFNHLFFECRETSNIWSRVLHWMGFRRQIMNWGTEVQQMSLLARSRGGLAEITSCVFAMVVYMVWQARNYIRFQRCPFHSEVLIKDMVLHLHIRGRDIATWKAILDKLADYPV
ncbi:hypothetical protein R3W88_029272 [Solanum pinnatisectum]|uniref:Reverse transcriptase zinc-binding domain-containing protein n=1 Tax=Solanum pinnatisectum TaxID=50273 RepID=A0AAV9K530_9SOLN|nr:hypothetical protein R3W88_029272 [Solanum pinnatisectum]